MNPTAALVLYIKPQKRESIFFKQGPITLPCQVSRISTQKTSLTFYRRLYSNIKATVLRFLQIASEDLPPEGVLKMPIEVQKSDTLLTEEVYI